MLRLRVVFQAPLPVDPKIFVTNHPTTSDPFILTAIIKEPASIFIRDYLFKAPVFGKYLELAGHIPVIPGEGKSAMEKALTLLKKGISIVVFIEGGTSPIGGGYHPPKTGAIRLALDSGCPIVPVGIRVARKNIKYAKTTLGKEEQQGIWYFNGPYCVTFGKSFRVKGNVEDRNLVRFLSEKLMKRIIFLAEKSANLCYS